MTPLPDDRFPAWLDDLEARHLSALEFREVTRAIRAVSATYVERRDRLARSGALDSAGKRAAFALYYGPLHFLVVREVVRAIGAAATTVATVVDLGCGTGAAGAAWAASLDPPASVVGVDRHPWACGEAAHTYRAFGLRSRVARGLATECRLPAPGSGIVAAFVVNELPPAERDRLLSRLTAAASRGNALLIVEPIARTVATWWDSWRRAWEAQGGRADEWRLRVPLPALVARFDRATGLSHDELTARSLWLPARDRAQSPRNR